jgi:hypothetical protein
VARIQDFTEKLMQTAKDKDWEPSVKAMTRYNPDKTWRRAW